MKPEAASRHELLSLALLTSLAAALRFYALGAQPLWLDEATTADYVAKGLEGSVFAEPPHPPLFYFLQYLVTQWLGIREMTLRLAPAVFGTLAVPATWAVARRLFPEPRATAWAAAVLAATSPFLIYLSQEARSYSLVILLTLLATAAFLRFCECPRGRELILHMALSALLIYTHYFGAWVLLAHEAVYWLHVRLRCTEWLLARANVALAFVPWALWAAPGLNLGSVAWVGSALVRAPYTLLRDLVGYGVAPQVLWGQPAEAILREEGWAVTLTVAPLLWLLARGAWQVWRSARSAHSGDAAMRRTLLVMLLVAPIAALVAVSPWAKLLHERAVSFQAPFVLMVIALGWATLRRRARIAAALASGAAIAFALAAYYGAPGELLGYPLRYGKEDWPAVAAHVDALQPDAVIVQPGYLHLALKRYWREPPEVVLLKDGPRAPAAERYTVARLAARRRVVLVLAWGGPAEQRLRESFARDRLLTHEQYFPMQGGLRVLTFDRPPSKGLGTLRRKRASRRTPEGRLQSGALRRKLTEIRPSNRSSPASRPLRRGCQQCT